MVKSDSIVIDNWETCVSLIKRERKLQSLRQVAFSGVSQSTISKVERGKMACDVAVFILILKALNFELVVKKSKAKRAKE